MLLLHSVFNLLPLTLLDKIIISNDQEKRITLERFSSAHLSLNVSTRKVSTEHLSNIHTKLPPFILWIAKYYKIKIRWDLNSSGDQWILRATVQFSQQCINSHEMGTSHNIVKERDPSLQGIHISFFSLPWDSARYIDRALKIFSQAAESLCADPHFPSICDLRQPMCQLQWGMTYCRLCCHDYSPSTKNWWLDLRSTSTLFKMSLLMM